MWRQHLVLILFFLGFGLIGVRLFYWQVVMGGKLAEAASDQYYFKLTLSPRRGNILASDGQALTTNKLAYLVYAEPKKVADKKEFAGKVGPLINLDPKEVLARLNQENIVWAALARKVEENKQSELANLKLTGLGFEKEGKRFYPEASFAAHLLGFVGSDDTGQDKGYFGLEGYYNLALKGKPGSLIQEKDAQGLPILLGESRRIPAEDGQTLELNLDRTVQFILEEKLKAGISRYGAKEGLVVVMDPKTGAVLGAAAYPAYDPRSFNSYPADVYPNPLVADTYEPGSTFKALVMAAALNERTVDPLTKYNEEGPVQIGEYSIRTWNNEYHGELTATQILEKSSNPGMVFVGQKLGKNKFYEYMDKFGFGKKTGIDLEEETSPDLRPRSEWKDIDLATASFGQGIAVTPIQMLAAIAALANEGNLMEPQVVKRMIDLTGKVIERKPKKQTQVITPITARVITEMLVSAVDNGEAKWAKPKGYRIAGKTGTAQIPVAGHYDANKTIASFVGFAPATNPKFAMLVLLREPSTSPWGSETAAPLFFNIAKDLFAYYGISPSN